MTSATVLKGTSRKTVARVLQSSVVAQVVNAAVGLIILPRVLHGLGVDRYGEWATLAAVLAIGQLAQSGVGTDIARRVAVANGGSDPAAMRQAVWQGVTVLVGLGCVLEIIAIVIARPAVDLVFSTVSGGQRGQLALLLIGAVTLFVVGLVGNGYFSVLVGLQRSDYSNWSTVASLLLGAVATVGGIALGLGLWALLVADTLTVIVSWAGPIAGIKRLRLDLPFRLVRVSRSVVFGFIGMPAMLVVASASDLFDSQVDKLVLTHVVGPQASGMFQIGVNLEQVLKNAALVPLAVMLAGTAELYRSNPGRLRHLEMLAGSTAQAIASIAAGGIILFARPFMTVWLGPGYGHAALSAQALAIAALLNIWSAPWTYYAIGRRRYHYVLIAASTTVVVNFVATIVLTSTIGLDGALIGSVAGSAAGTLVARLVLLKWERRSWLTPALVTTGLTGLVVGPLAYFAMPFAATWPSLIAWGSLYVALTGVLLLAAGVLPVRVALRAGQLRLVIREPTPTRRHSVRRHT